MFYYSIVFYFAVFWTYFNVVFVICRCDFRFIDDIFKFFWVKLSLFRNNSIFAVDVFSGVWVRSQVVVEKFYFCVGGNYTWDVGDFWGEDDEMFIVNAFVKVTNN